MLRRLAVCFSLNCNDNYVTRSPDLYNDISRSPPRLTTGGQSSKLHASRPNNHVPQYQSIPQYLTLLPALDIKKLPLKSTKNPTSTTEVPELSSNGLPHPLDRIARSHQNHHHHPTHTMRATKLPVNEPDDGYSCSNAGQETRGRI